MTDDPDDKLAWLRRMEEKHGTTPIRGHSPAPDNPRYVNLRKWSDALDYALRVGEPSHEQLCDLRDLWDWLESVISDDAEAAP